MTTKRTVLGWMMILLVGGSGCAKCYESEDAKEKAAKAAASGAPRTTAVQAPPIGGEGGSPAQRYFRAFLEAGAEGGADGGAHTP